MIKFMIFLQSRLSYFLVYQYHIKYLVIGNFTLTYVNVYHKKENSELTENTNEQISLSKSLTISFKTYFNEKCFTLCNKTFSDNYIWFDIQITQGNALTTMLKQFFHEHEVNFFCLEQLQLLYNCLRSVRWSWVSTLSSWIILICSSILLCGTVCLINQWYDPNTWFMDKT